MNQSSLKLIYRNEREDFIITLLSERCRVHLCYLNKQKVLENHNIDLELVAKEFNGDPLEMLSHLKYNKVIQRN